MYKIYKSDSRQAWWIIKEDHFWYYKNDGWTYELNIHSGLNKVTYVTEFETDECPMAYAKTLMLLEDWNV